MRLFFPILDDVSIYGVQRWVTPPHHSAIISLQIDLHKPLRSPVTSTVFVFSLSLCVATWEVISSSLSVYFFPFFNAVVFSESADLFLPNKCQDDEFQLQAPLEALLFSEYASSPPSSFCPPISMTILVHFSYSAFKPVSVCLFIRLFFCTTLNTALRLSFVFSLHHLYVSLYCRLFCSNSLRKLSAGHNQLQKLPERVERPLLEVLDVQHNQLVELPCNLFLKSDR